MTCVDALRNPSAVHLVRPHVQRRELALEPPTFWFSTTSTSANSLHPQSPALLSAHSGLQKPNVFPYRILDNVNPYVCLSKQLDRSPSSPFRLVPKLNPTATPSSGGLVTRAGYQTVGTSGWGREQLAPGSAWTGGCSRCPRGGCKRGKGTSVERDWISANLT